MADDKNTHPKQMSVNCRKPDLSSSYPTPRCNVPMPRDSSRDAAVQRSIRSRQALPLACDLVDRFGQSLHIARRDASHRNTAVFGSVDRVLLSQCVHLCCCEAGVGKHANLHDVRRLPETAMDDMLTWFVM